MPGLTPAQRHVSPLVTVLRSGAAARTGRSECQSTTVLTLVTVVTKPNLTTKLFLKKVQHANKL